MNLPLAADLYLILMKLREGGGSIVSIADCTDAEIALARFMGRLYLDRDGHGFVYRPKVAPGSTDA